MNAIPTKSHAEGRLSRRHFLDLLWKGLLTVSGLVGLSGLAKFFDYQPAEAHASKVDLGPLENFPPDTSTLLPKTHTIITRAGDKVSALNATCPHLGCTVAQDGDGFTCPCHGSRFDKHGQLVKGPATKNLQPQEVDETTDEHLILISG